MSLFFLFKFRGVVFDIFPLCWIYGDIFSGNEVECVLFDECSGQAYVDQLKEMENPVVALVNLARIAFDEDGW